MSDTKTFKVMLREFHTTKSSTMSLNVYRDIGEEERDKLFQSAQKDAVMQAMEAGFNNFETAGYSVIIVPLIQTVEITVIYTVRGIN